MLVLFIVALSPLAILTPVTGEITHECSYVNGTSFTNLWTSVPLLLTGETSATVYFCSSNLSTLEIALLGPRSFRSAVYVRGAISQVAPTPSSWNYTDIITCFVFCDEHSIMAYFSAFIPHREHYVNLVPNTLYSVAIIGCITDDDDYISHSECTIENFSGYVVEYYLGFVSTRPRVPTCYIESYITAIKITFKLDSAGNLGPLAHGYEVVVWQVEREDTKNLKSFHYFPAVSLPTYCVTVDGLTSNMIYLVQIRANGSHIPNMKSAWVETRIQTLAHGPSVPNILQHIQRGTVVLFRLNSSDIVTYGVRHCQVELTTVSLVDGTSMKSLLNLTISDHDLDGDHYLFIESLVPNQDYSLRLAAVNDVGVSRFTEWVNVTTTSAVMLTPSDASGALILQWTPPTLFDSDSLLQYEVTLTPLGVGSSVQVRYTLPSTQSELTAQGLQEGVEYQVMIETRVDSGLVQPFYSMNITIPSLMVPVSPASSAAVANGVAGAGVTLLLVLVCVAVVGVLLVVVFLKWRKGGNEQTRKERSSSQRNISDTCDEVTVKANPAYAAVEYDVGEGADPQPYKARYHSQEDVIDQLRDEGGGLRDGAGLGCDEPRVEKADRALYENVTR